MFDHKELLVTQDPATAVTKGALIFGRKYQQELEDKLLLKQITLLDISIEREGGLAEVIMPRGLETPAKREIKWTVENDAEKLISIYEGARPLYATTNHNIGYFDVSSIMSAQGWGIVDLLIEVDENGVYKLTASTKEGRLEFIIPNNNDVEDVRHIVADAEMNKEHDIESQHTSLNKLHNYVHHL